MTNEEIRKRFLFDLEIGLFKILPTLSKTPSYYFWESPMGKKGLFTLIDLLNNAGYRINSSLLSGDFIAVVVCPELKFYSLTQQFAFFSDVNNVPDYVKEYKYEPDK